MPETMLAGRSDVRTRDFAVEEVPKPSPGPGEVLVRVAAAGNCPSDVHLVEGQLSPLFLTGDAVTLGHEVAGTVAGLGDGVTGATVEQRVLLQAGEEKDGWVHTRGVDYDGDWAEYAPATVGTIVPVPDGMPLEQPASCRTRSPRRGLDRADRGRPGRSAGRRLGHRRAGRARRVAPVREQAVRTLERDDALVLVGLTDQPLSIRNGTRFSYFGQRIIGHYGSEPALRARARARAGVPGPARPAGPLPVDLGHPAADRGRPRRGDARARGGRSDPPRPHANDTVVHGTTPRPGAVPLLR